jgi:hypothetical protein
LGFSASQGSSFDVGDETQSFDVPAFCSSGVGVNEIVLQNFVIYPNPGNEVIFIKSNSDFLLQRVVVRDLSGALVSVVEFSSENYQITTDTWSNGVYILEVESTRGVEFFRWVKQ